MRGKRNQDLGLMNKYKTKNKSYTIYKSINTLILSENLRSTQQ